MLTLGVMPQRPPPVQLVRLPRKKLDPSWSEEAMCTLQGYTIIKKLGEGSFGVVYLCEKKKDANKRLTYLATKVIDTSKANTRYVQKFLNREIDILLRVKHQFVIHIYCIIQRRHKYYIFMRYAEKGDLLEHLNGSRSQNKGPLTENQARLWTGQIGHALLFLHTKQIAHRDIKCENILITGHNNAKLADFGFATRFEVKAGQPVPLTTYCGTPSYACPEILRSIPYNPEKADLWALGVVLYVMINGTLPFPAKTSSKILELQKQPIQMRKEVKVSTDLLQIFPRIFDVNPKRRWEVEQFLQSDWFAKDPTFAARMTASSRSRKYQRSDAEQSAIQASERQRYIIEAKRNDEASSNRVVQIKPFFSGSSVGSMGILIPFKADSLAAFKRSKTAQNSRNSSSEEDIVGIPKKTKGGPDRKGALRPETADPAMPTTTGGLPRLQPAVGAGSPNPLRPSAGGRTAPKKQQPILIPNIQRLASQTSGL